MKKNKLIHVALLAIGATFFGSFMGAGVKLLSSDLHPIIICFYRCLMGLIIITPFVARNNFKAVRYEKLIPLLLEGIKEQQSTIVELKERIEKLENK